MLIVSDAEIGSKKSMSSESLGQANLGKNMGKVLIRDHREQGQFFFGRKIRTEYFPQGGVVSDNHQRIFLFYLFRGDFQEKIIFFSKKIISYCSVPFKKSVGRNHIRNEASSR